MSPLWPNKLTIVVSKTSIALVHLGGLKKKVLQKQHIALNGDMNDALIQQVLNKLEPFFADQRAQYPNASFHLRVLLASDFVRYLTLPAHDRLLSASDKHDFARAAFYEVYGIATDTWKIVCDDAPPNQPTLIAAIDTVWITSLRKIADRHHFRLVSLQPYLAAISDRIQPKLPMGEVYLAVVETGRLLLTTLTNKRWQTVRSFVLEQNWQEQLSNIALREAIAVSETPKNTLMVYAPGYKNVSLPSVNGWNVGRAILSQSWIKANLSQTNNSQLKLNQAEDSKIQNTSFAMLEAAI